MGAMCDGVSGGPPGWAAGGGAKVGVEHEYKCKRQWESDGRFPWLTPGVNHVEFPGAERKNNAGPPRTARVLGEAPRAPSPKGGAVGNRNTSEQSDAGRKCARKGVCKRSARIMRPEQDQSQIDDFIKSIANVGLAEVVVVSGSWIATIKRSLESAPGGQSQDDATEKR